LIRDQLHGQLLDNDGASEIRMGNALRDGYGNRAFLMTKIDGRSKREATRQLEESLILKSPEACFDVAEETLGACPAADESDQHDGSR
jgi:hypothetical protein